MTGWWAFTARALALVLALVVGMPAVGLAEDVSYHQDHPGHERTELAVMPDGSSGGTQDVDPGIACHVHCGCHVAATVDVTEPAPLTGVSRPSYACVSETVTSVPPDRLPRPPRV